MKLVGADRQAQVKLLLDSFDWTVEHRQPHLVSLEAPQGWGKTRVIQSFYGQLADRQPLPAYWPSSLVDPAETDPLLLRKQIVPGPSQSDAEMPWMWWGVSCSRRQAGALAHVLAEDVDQLHQHFHAFLAAHEDNERLKNEVRELLISISGFLPGVGQFVSVAQAAAHASQLSVHVIERAAGGGYAQAKLRLSGSADPGRAPLVGKIVDLLLLAGKRVPFVMVIEDAHDADASVIALLDRIFAGPLPAAVLCLLTAWPDRLAQQQAKDDGLGAWLARATDRDPERCVRSPLDPLQTRALSALVRQHAPRTSASVANAFALRADGNPLVLEGMLRVPTVEQATREGRIELSPDYVAAKLPNTYDKILMERWDALPNDVRAAAPRGGLGARPRPRRRQHTRRANPPCRRDYQCRGPRACTRTPQ